MYISGEYRPQWVNKTICFVVYNEHRVSENLSHFSAPWLTKRAHTKDEFVTAPNHCLIMTMMT
jgi:hypothetical protein